LIHINATSRDFPDNLLIWKTFQANTIMPLGCDLEYSVINASNGESFAGSAKMKRQSGYDISECATNYSGIKLNAEAIILSSSTPGSRLLEGVIHTWLLGRDRPGHRPGG
jgi:hypothetical protein